MNYLWLKSILKDSLAKKSDAGAQKQKDRSHSVLSPTWNLARAMSFASPRTTAILSHFGTAAVSTRSLEQIWQLLRLPPAAVGASASAAHTSSCIG